VRHPLSGFNIIQLSILPVDRMPPTLANPFVRFSAL
jgi:hypothetical protein